MFSNDDANKNDAVRMKTTTLASYRREKVSNLDGVEARHWFDRGLFRLFAYHHEEAARCFSRCLALSPDCAFVHGLLAVCHCPNYNFHGADYYRSTYCRDTSDGEQFPSQLTAEKNSGLALEKVEELRRSKSNLRRGSTSSSNNRRGSTSSSNNRRGSSGGRRKKLNGEDGGSGPISPLERDILSAIRKLTQNPGVDPLVAVETNQVPYVDEMRKVYGKYQHDPEVIYLYAESLMVLNAWKLYEYPTGRAISPHVEEAKYLLETGLGSYPKHAGLCHLYIHLCEMSAHPELALDAGLALRSECQDSGHLIHMSTHIDVLIGDYESCVRHNAQAIESDLKVMKECPDTSGILTFYFGYIVHDFHMLVYGAMLGGMEKKGMEVARHLQTFINEQLFVDHYELTLYLESYSAMDIHILVRFGHWEDILRLDIPQHEEIMIYRTAVLRYARGLAFAAKNDVERAKQEALLFNSLRNNPLTSERILHNNTIADLLSVDYPMLMGEIAYRQGNYQKAFVLLREAIHLEDNLNFDEPWGKMQPVRHALGGLLLEQGRVLEAKDVFRADLKFHPNNPWSLTGIIACYDTQIMDAKTPLSPAANKKITLELVAAKYQLEKQRRSKWVDYEITASCACCGLSFIDDQKCCAKGSS